MSPHLRNGGRPKHPGRLHREPSDTGKTSSLRPRDRGRDRPLELLAQEGRAEARRDLRVSEAVVDALVALVQVDGADATHACPGALEDPDLRDFERLAGTFPARRLAFPVQA